MKPDNELIEKIEIAIKMVAQSPDNWSDHFSSTEDFHRAMKDALEKLRSGDNSVINSLIAWFVPSYDWDDFVGDVDLGNEIYDLLIEYRNQTDFEKHPDKAEALKVIKAFFMMNETEAAYKLAKIFDISEEELNKIPRRDR